MNKKVWTSLLVIGLAVLAIAGGTLAWFTSQSGPIENVFTAGTVEIEADEDITSGVDTMSNWNPGDCAVKEFTITNSGTKKIVLRTTALAEMHGQWYEQDGITEWTPTALENGVPPVMITVVEDESHKWTLLGDYYYYDGVIESESEVKLTLKVCLNGPQLTNDYQGKMFKMSVGFAAIQASHDASGDAWGVTWDDDDGWKAVEKED